MSSSAFLAAFRIHLPRSFPVVREHRRFTEASVSLQRICVARHASSCWRDQHYRFSTARYEPSELLYHQSNTRPLRELGFQLCVSMCTSIKVDSLIVELSSRHFCTLRCFLRQPGFEVYPGSDVIRIRERDEACTQRLQNLPCCIHLAVPTRTRAAHSFVAIGCL